MVPASRAALGHRWSGGCVPSRLMRFCRALRRRSTGISVRCSRAERYAALRAVGRLRRRHPTLIASVAERIRPDRGAWTSVASADAHAGRLTGSGERSFHRHMTGTRGRPAVRPVRAASAAPPWSDAGVLRPGPRRAVSLSGGRCSPRAGPPIGKRRRRASRSVRARRASRNGPSRRAGEASPRWIRARS